MDNGDPGQSRNDAVAVASGSWIAFLDADDLWDEHWLNEGLKAARGDSREIVWHPEVSLYFGAELRIFRSIDMELNEFELTSLLASNYWTALCLARRTLLLNVPHPRTDLRKKVGHEDWSWNLEVIEHGAMHKVVPGTGHGIRAKASGSVMRTSTAAGAIPKPSNVFRKLLEDKARARTGKVGSEGESGGR